MKKNSLLILLLFSFLMAYSQSDKDRQKKIGKFIKDYPAWVYILESSFKTPDLVINEGGFLIFKTEVSNWPISSMAMGSFFKSEKNSVHTIG